ncbi:Maf family protein [Estrella lausannensis]|uniref:dTTP/UTP pyrophosphatase n=1 Tax=Estrella lausannensis TaxID=483423 RepID=A0A0H5DPY7_9BACT|nr:nucleoside triphosphate pyrophosphatase [Estrella lausannensis]CRX38088.1 Putative septum formation protein Maf [Estrella lausannensis]
MTKIILGSSSPRRKEIISYFKLPFEQASPDFDEESVPFTGSPAEYVITIAEGKMQMLLPRHETKVVITADTTVYREGRVFGKPTTKEEAFEYVNELQGKWHSVFSGVSVASALGIDSDYEETQVLFNPLTKEQILHYHSHIDWKDKAGGYAIQGSGSLLIRRIEGCFFNVMGLPVNTMGRLLQKHGVNLWNNL